MMYYRIKFDINIKFDSWFRVFNWLDDNVGDENSHWYYEDISHQLFFKSEEDKVKFILKWI